MSSKHVSLKILLSPLQKAALAWAGGLFLAWERAFLIFPVILVVSLICWRKHFFFFLLASVSFLLGIKIFPSPTIPLTERIKGTFSFQLEKALVPGTLFQKGEAKLLPYGDKVVIYLPKKIKLTPGSVFEAKVSLKPPRGSLNPFSGDYGRELKARGINYVGYVREVEILHEKEGFTPIQNLRKSLFSFSETLSPKAQGLFQALILGEKRNLPQDLRLAYEKAGLFHLLAVSGLHIGLLFFLVRLSVKPLFALKPELLDKLTAEQWYFICAFPALLTYTLISGPSPSAQRAFLMFSLWGMGLLLFREVKGFDVLAATALLILLISPESIGSLSFRLSVTAVAALILAHYILKKLTLPKNRAKAYVIKGFLYSLFASLATSPFILWLKGSISPWGSLTNILAIPIFGFFVLPLEFLAAGLSFFVPDKAAYLAELASRIASFPDISLPQISSPFPVGAFLWILLLLAMSVFFWNKRKLFLAFLVLVLCLGAFFYRENQKLRFVSILDVGQGSAAVAKVGGKEALLFDTGPARGPYDSAHFSIIPFLRKMGLTPRAVIISHFQADHAGGLKTILKTYPQVKPISSYNAPTLQKIKTGDFELYLFPGPKDFTENDASLVAKLELAEKSFLFPGDVTCKREKILVNKDISADVLILPHHGSNTSSSPFFLERVHPQMALSSSRWQIHPSAKTLARLKKFGIPHYGTKTHGALTVLIREDSSWLCLETKRRQAPLLLRSLWPFIKTGCTEVSL